VSVDKLSKEQRSKNMRAVKSSGSVIETSLAKALFAEGLRYRKNDKSVFGKPDLTFKKYKIAIFVDSEFWHGFDWELKKEGINTNKEFWIRKIERNIERDNEVNIKLVNDGWKVFRFWGKEIKKNIDGCVLVVKNEIVNRKNGFTKEQNN
jgi:DNA mismatch endonuclease Vsr